MGTHICSDFGRVHTLAHIPRMQDSATHAGEARIQAGSALCAQFCCEPVLDLLLPCTSQPCIISSSPNDDMPNCLPFIAEESKKRFPKRVFVTGREGNIVVFWWTKYDLLIVFGVRGVMMYKERKVTWRAPDRVCKEQDEYKVFSALTFTPRYSQGPCHSHTG